MYKDTKITQMKRKTTPHHSTRRSCKDMAKVWITKKATLLFKA
jgi:hypothetical protein